MKCSREQRREFSAHIDRGVARAHLVEGRTIRSYALNRTSTRAELLKYFDALEDFYGKDVGDYVITKEDIRNIWTAIAYAAFVDGRDDDLEGMLITATALSKLGECPKPRPDRYTEDNRPSEQAFMDALYHECQHRFVGKTWSEWAKTIVCDGPLRMEELVKQSCVEETRFTKQTVREMIILAYYEVPTDMLEHYMRNPANLGITVSCLCALSLEAHRQREKAQRRAERNTTPRPPTKKQSEVIADLKAQLKAQAEALEKSEEKCAKTQLDAQRQEEAQRRDIESLHAELAKAQERAKALEEELELQEEVDEATELLDLPTTGVVFLGGHQQMVANLRKRYPGWRYLDGTSQLALDFGDADVVFVYTNHLAHKVSYQVDAHAKDRAIYINCGTNIDRMQKLMQYLYTKQKKGDVIR